MPALLQSLRRLGIWSGFSTACLLFSMSSLRENLTIVILLMGKMSVHSTGSNHRLLPRLNTICRKKLLVGSLNQLSSGGRRGPAINNINTCSSHSLSLKDSVKQNTRVPNGIYQSQSLQNLFISLQFITVTIPADVRLARNQYCSGLKRFEVSLLQNFLRKYFDGYLLQS